MINIACSNYQSACILHVHEHRFPCRYKDMHVRTKDSLCVQSEHVHRDLRWENVACHITKTQYFLLDLELCAKVNKKPSFNLQSWHSETLVGGRYTVASDLHSLGRTLYELDAIIVSKEGRSFLAELRRPAQEQQHSAEQLLSHAWIKCQGVRCRVAGAHPNDV